MTSEFRWYGDRAKKQINEKVANDLTGMAADIVKLAQQNVNQSPPGHPQVQTGTLRRSITMDVDRRNLTAKVGIMSGSSDADQALIYAPFLEFGTSTMGPYPFLFPAAETITKRAREYFR